MDADGSDGEASFELPNPNYTSTGDLTGTTEYSVWIRPLGSGGSVTIKTCAEDPDAGYIEVCSSESITVSRTRGSKPQFQDVSRYLLTIVVDGKRYGIFDDEFENYFWEYDNNGLKILQMRFYEMSSEIN